MYLNAFNNDTYKREDLLTELLKLQSEMAAITFHGEKDDAKIWDIVNELKIQNNIYHSVSEDEMLSFIKQSHDFADLIKAMLSGIRGESSVQKRLNELYLYNDSLHNVELFSMGKRTELDYIVLTQKGICILEVKNSKNDVFISEDGDLFTNGSLRSYRCNLLYKQKLREDMLRSILQDAGINNVQINSMVVFANDQMDIQNHCPQIRVISLEDLNDAFRNMKSRNHYSPDVIQKMTETIRNAQTQSTYAPTMDMQAFKKSFASICNELENKKVTSGHKESVKFTGFLSGIRNLFQKKNLLKAA